MTASISINENSARNIREDEEKKTSLEGDISDGEHSLPKDDKNETDDDEENQVEKQEFEPLSIDVYLDQPDLMDSHGDASFTGVWEAAKELMNYLKENNDSPFLSNNPQEGLAVLEVGAGTGWLGITLAATFGGASLRQVCLTDTPNTGAVQWTQKNVDAAQQQGLPHMECVHVQPMDWNDEDQILDVAAIQKFDLIVGSDLIYTEDGCMALARTLATLLKHQPQARLLYAHSQGRIPDLDVLWENQLKQRGIQSKLLVQKQQSWNKDRITLVSEFFFQMESTEQETDQQ